MVDVAHVATKQASLLLFSPTLSEPALSVEDAMRVYLLAKAGRTKSASSIAHAAPCVGRVWRQGLCRPSELMELYRRWVEEGVLMRTAEAERRTLPEHDRRARLPRLRRYLSTTMRRRRRQVAITCHDAAGTPLQDLQSCCGGVYSAAEVGAEEAEEFLRFVRVWGGGDEEWERGHTEGLSYAFWAQFAHDRLESAEAAQVGGAMPRTLKAIVTLTSPQSELLEDDREVRCRATRIWAMPLMQIGCKLLVLQAKAHLSVIAVGTVAEPQKGFVSGRRIEDSIRRSLHDGELAQAGGMRWA